MEMPCVSAASIWLDETENAENVSLPMDDAILNVSHVGLLLCKAKI